MKKFFTGLTILISLGNASAQVNSYIRVPESKMKTLNSYDRRGSTIRKVSKLDTEKFVAKDTITDYVSLAGDYQYIESYGLCPANVGNYQKDELVENNVLVKTLYNNNLNSYVQQVSLYKKIGSEEYVSDNNEFLNRFGTAILAPGTKTNADKLKEYLALLNSKGYQTKEDGNKVYITTKFGKVLASGEMYTEVQKGNFKYIDQVASSVNQYKVLSVQAKPYVSKLGNHYSAHLNKTMTKTRMITWRNDAKNAIAIYNKINNLVGFNSNNFLNNIDTNMVNVTTEFMQVVNGSKQVLGM